MLAQRASPGWEASYRDNVLPLYRFVYARVGNRRDAEDLTSQVFLRALPRLEVRTANEVRAYLFATARTALADHWQDRYRVGSDELLVDVEAPVHLGSSAGAERRAGDILGLLPERYRRLLEMRFLGGLSVRETAREMGITETNAKVMQLRALRKAAELGGGVPCGQLKHRCPRSSL